MLPAATARAILTELEGGEDLHFASPFRKSRHRRRAAPAGPNL
jgi:hypothetical protein